jgi:hypothetical protein
MKWSTVVCDWCHPMVAFTGLQLHSFKLVMRNTREACNMRCRVVRDDVGAHDVSDPSEVKALGVRTSRRQFVNFQ